MFNYYTALTYTVFFSQMIMLLIISSDCLLPKRNRNGFYRVFITFSSLTFTEWLAVLLSQQGGVFSMISAILMRVVFVFAPVIPILIASTYSQLRHIKFILGLLSLNLFLQILIYFDSNYYMSSKNVLDTGNLYLFFLGIFVITLLIMCYYVHIISRNFQTKNGFHLLLILANLLIGFYLQSALTNIFVFRVAATFSAIFLYSQYCVLLNKADALTSLLNRRCFTNRLKKMNKDSIILFMDIDKFKEINDTMGHTFGDYALKEIGQLLKNVYGKNGVCFRTGGDEFCVIVNKKLNQIDEMNQTLRNRLDKKRAIEPKLPDISVGYSYFHKNTSKIDDVLEEADKMMYDVKRKRKAQIEME